MAHYCIPFHTYFHIFQWKSYDKEYRSECTLSKVNAQIVKDEQTDILDKLMYHINRIKDHIFGENQYDKEKNVSTFFTEIWKIKFLENKVLNIYIFYYNQKIKKKLKMLFLWN